MTVNRILTPEEVTAVAQAANKRSTHLKDKMVIGVLNLCDSHELLRKRLPSQDPIPESEQLRDNILVGRRKGGLDFLSIYLGPSEEFLPREISLCRYSVPGRVDVYSFDWVPGGTGVGDRVRFFSDFNRTMRQALRLLEQDLDKPQVVEMLVEASKKAEVAWIYRTFVGHFLPIVAPRSKALRACKRAFKIAHQKRREEYMRRKAERKT